MKQRKQPPEPVDLNMVPVMNLFLAMIPFLLSCAAFYQAAVINASVPALSEGGDDSAAEEPKKQLDKVTLNLQIGKEGFTLSFQGEQPPEELKSLSGKIVLKGNEYDFEKLGQRCKEVHDRYKASDTVILLPEKDILYDVIVKAMDASRERIIDIGKDQRESLFTNAVVTSIL